MQLKLPYNGMEAEGVARVKQMLNESRAKIAENATDVKEEWSGNVLAFGFTAQGQRIEGTLTVRDKEFELYAKLPLTLRLFEGTIERMLQAEAAKLRL